MLAGGTLYEVPENGSWPDDTANDTTTHHGFPSTHAYSVNPAASDGGAERSSRLPPRVEPLGMYANNNGIAAQRGLATHDTAATPAKTAANAVQTQNGKQFQSFMPPHKPPSYGLSPQPVKNHPNYPQSHPALARLSGPPGVADRSPANRQSRPAPAQQLELERHVNKHSYQALLHNSCDNQPASMPKMTLSNQKPATLRANESQESSFMTLHQHQRAPLKSIKKAVQFADDVIAKTNDVANVRALNGHAASALQRHDRTPLEVRVSDKSKQNPGFHDDMNGLGYSVV